MKTIPWDPAEHLDTQEAVIAYLNAAFEDGDPALVAAALRDVGRARGVADLATTVAASPQSRSQSQTDFATVLQVLKTLGIALSARHEATTGQG